MDDDPKNRRYQDGLAPIKALLLDLDGTLLTSHNELTSRNLDAMRRVSESGVRVILASGRPSSSILQFAAKLKGNQYIVASNGGSTIETPSGRVLHCSEMPRLDTDYIIDVAAKNGAAACLYNPLKWFVKEVDNQVQIEVTRSGTVPQIIKNLKAAPGPIIKALLIGEQNSLSKCESAFKEGNSGQLEWFYTFPEYLEVMPIGTNKGKACAQLLRDLEVAEESTMAIGDGMNDLSLFGCSGTKVAVANASPGLIRAADFVTLSNDHDGVATAIEALIFSDSRSLVLMMQQKNKSRQ